MCVSVDTLLCHCFTCCSCRISSFVVAVVVVVVV